MEKTNERDVLSSVQSNANSVNFEATNLALKPPTLQLKVDQSTPEENVQEENQQPYQFAAEGSGPPPNDDNDGDGNGTPFKPNNTGLPTQLKSGVESLSGYSLDDVKVHYNSDKPAQLKAHAFAQGTDIHLGAGQEKHLPHEAWHVVQQKQGRVQPTRQLKAFNINDDTGLEKEADVMGAKAMQIKTSSDKPPNPSANNIAPFQLYSDVVQREKFDVDTDYATNLMNKSGYALFSHLHYHYFQGEVESLEDMEKIAELLAMIFPVEARDFNFMTASSDAELALELKAKIRERFKDNFLRRLYLESILKVPYGEPSMFGRALMASGLLSSLNVNSDLDFVLSIFEKATPEELDEFKDSHTLDFIINNLKVRSNYISVATHTTKAKIDYLEQHIKNKTTDYDSDDVDDDQKLKDKDQEGKFLIEIFTNKMGPYNEGKLLKKEPAVEKIKEWSKNLSDEERTYILSRRSKIYKYINNREKVDPYYRHYLMALFTSKGGDDSEDDKEDQASSDAEIFIQYLTSKKGTKSKKYNSVIDQLESLSLEARLKVLSHYSSQSDLTTNLDNREDAIKEFETKLKTGWNIQPTELRNLLNGFRWGVVDGATDKKGPIANIYSILEDRSCTNYGKKLLPHIRNLNPSEILQIQRNTEIKNKIQYIKHDEANKYAPKQNKYWRSISILLDIPSWRVLMNGVSMSEEEEREDSVDRIELRPEYWSEKIALDINDRSIWNRSTLRRNKNPILSIISQAIHAAERAVADESSSYEDIEDFTKEILTTLPDSEKEKLRDGLVIGYNALNTGEQVGIEDRLDTAELHSPLKRARGYKMKLSAVVQAIVDSSGDELLYQWSDYPEFLVKIQDLDEKERKAQIAVYIPEAKASLMSRLKDALPANEFSNVHKDLLLKMSSALRNDDKFKGYLESIGAENLSLRAEMLKSLGLLSREQIVDTGWQMKYFSTKGPIRKEAKRIVLHRLRTAKRGIIDNAPKLDDLEERLGTANEELAERTDAFEATKEKAIKAIVFTVSIILGILTTAGSLGLAGPLIAAGLPTLLASFLISTVFTGVASSIKLVLESKLSGGTFNMNEGIMNVIKDILMAATTVCAGQAGEQLMEAWKMTPGIAALFEAAESEGASVGSKLLASFTEKFLAVSPVEVLFRNITERAYNDLTAIEADERESITWGAAARFLRDFTVDAVLKTTMDVVGTEAFGVIDEDSSVITPESSPGADDQVESIGPLLSRLDAGQVIAIIAAENFITSQNYSVAEQDSIIGSLVVDRAVDWASDKVEDAVTTTSDHEREITSRTEKLTLKEKIERLPLGLIIDKFIDADEFASMIASKDPELRVPLIGLNIGKDKLIAIITKIKANNEDVTKDQLKSFFGNIVTEEVLVASGFRSIKRKKKRSRSRGKREDAKEEGRNPIEIDGEVFFDADNELGEDLEFPRVPDLDPGEEEGRRDDDERKAVLV